MITSALIFLLTFLFAFYSTKKIIYISHKKHLFDEPTEDRKIHRTRTPNLGGVAMFASVMCASALFVSYSGIENLNYIIASAVILFVTGLTDDLVGVNPAKKIVAQLAVALIITLAAGFRFTSLYGLFGIHELPVAVSVALSVLFILFLINAFNLIDGINCLAGGIGLLACAVFAWCFWQMQTIQLFYLAVSMCACLLCFLYFNRTPARIFMGDTGSLLLGFIIAVFTIHFLELNHKSGILSSRPIFLQAPAIMVSLLIVPVFDTLRVFSLRLLQRKSPFHADRNHVHHRLIDLGFSHMQATGLLILATVTCLLLALALRNLPAEMLLGIIATYSLLANWSLSMALTAKTRRHIVVAPFKVETIATAHFAEPGLSLFKSAKEVEEEALAEMEA